MKYTADTVREDLFVPDQRRSHTPDFLAPSRESPFYVLRNLGRTGRIRQPLKAKGSRSKYNDLEVYKIKDGIGSR
jgi:hypothetical protein